MKQDNFFTKLDNILEIKGKSVNRRDNQDMLDFSEDSREDALH